MNTKKRLLEIFLGTFATLVLFFTTIVCAVPVFFLGILKLFPIQRWQIFCMKQVDKVAACWSAINNTFLEKLQPVDLEITGPLYFNPQQWYLMVANHQSAVDIVVLQRIFNRKIPAIKYFIKDQLKWIPILGFSWWAMGYPFMKRYSKAYLEKHPEKKGKDAEATKKALKFFKQTPGTFISFVEGTRFTIQKKLQQNSPYQYLLMPRAGGVGLVISAMGKKISQLIDVTIIYPQQKSTLWDFLCHRIKSIKVHIRQLPIPLKFLDPHLIDNQELITEFRNWLNKTWCEKDQLISYMKTESQ